MIIHFMQLYTSKYTKRYDYKNKDEPVSSKWYKLVCEPTEDSDQPVNLCIQIGVYYGLSTESYWFNLS